MAIKVSQPKGNKETDIVYFHATIKAGDNRVRITCLDENQNIPDLKVNMEDLPTFPKIEPKMLVEDCNVIYDRKNDEVLAINPWKGVFEAVGTDIGPHPEGEDSDPIAETHDKVGQDGKPYTEKKFYEVFKITDKQEYDGFFYGTQPRKYFQDKFYETANGMTDIAGTSKSRWTMALIEMVKEQGLDADIEWPEDGNVLPILLDRLLESKRKVRISFKDGWLDSITSLGGRVVREVEEVDEDEAPKKPVKKNKAPVAEDDPDDVDDEFPVKVPVKVKPAKRVQKDEDEEDDEL